MDDKCIMENLLLTEKGVCDLYVHGTIESSTTNVHQTFNQALNDSLCLQDDIRQNRLNSRRSRRLRTSSQECRFRPR